MPAIDAALPAAPTPTPGAAAESRPMAQNAVKPAKMANGDSQASDAFIAALLAQSTAQMITPEQPAAAGEAGTALAASTCRHPGRAPSGGAPGSRFRTNHGGGGGRRRTG